MFFFLSVTTTTPAPPTATPTTTTTGAPTATPTTTPTATPTTTTTRKIERESLCFSGQRCYLYSVNNCGPSYDHAAFGEHLHF